MTTDASDPMIGQAFGRDGRLVVRRRIGEGGMGSVYEALDQKSQRSVAIKFLRPESSGDTVERFRREGQRFQALEHPNIVKVYGLGKEHGMLYLACEFVQGRTLGDVIHEEGVIAPARAVRITRQVASALAAAHEAQVVHRDLKPDNIMLRNEDDDVRLLDFGIAKILDSDSVLTRVGTYMGTPGYSAPEQIQGLKVDHRADIFPLGVILWEMLTGQVAFEGRDTRQVLASTLKAKPREITKIRDEVTKPLARLIDRMIEKNRDKRFRTMREVIEAIDDLGNLPAELMHAVAHG